MITSTKCNNYLMSHILLQLLLPAHPGIHRSAGDRFCITVLVACVGPFLDYLYKPWCIHNVLGNVQAQKSSLEKTINRTKNHHLIFHRWWVKVNMIERTINQYEIYNFFISNNGGFHFGTKHRNYTSPYQKKLGFNESVCIQLFFHLRSDIFLWQFIIRCSLAVWDLSYVFIECYTRVIETQSSNYAFLAA